jgi:hypothetical protein
MNRAFENIVEKKDCAGNQSTDTLGQIPMLAFEENLNCLLIFTNGQFQHFVAWFQG